GGVLAALGDHSPAALEDLRDVLLDNALDTEGIQVRVASSKCRVHEIRPNRVVLGRDPHEAADDARHDGLGDVSDEIACLPARETIEDVDGDRPDRVLVCCDPLGGEASLEERLDAVVLGRVHSDEHRLHELERKDRRGGGDAPALRRVGLPIAAHRVYVVRGRYRPVPRFPGIFGDVRAPVDGALLPESSKQLVRRPVLPLLTLDNELVLEIAAGRRHRGPRGRFRPRSYWLSTGACSYGAKTP